MKRHLLLIFGPVLSVIMVFFLLTVSSCDNDNHGGENTPAPGAVDMSQNGIFGYSTANNFFIQNVSENGMGEEVSNGQWNNTWDSMTSFTMADGRQYIFGHRKNYDWFIQEILPTGDLGLETSGGTFEHYFPVLSAFTIPGGKTFIYGQMQVDNPGASSFWFIREIEPGGVPSPDLTDDGYWESWYPNALVTNPNSQSPVLFGEDSNGNWFLRPISEDGKMQEESGHGQYDQYYDTIQTYTVGGDVFLFGQRADTKQWFIQGVWKLMPFTDLGVWNDYYNTVAPFSINGRTFFFLQSGTYWNIMEVLSDGKMGSQIGPDGTWKHHYEFVFPVNFDPAYLDIASWMTNNYDLIKNRTLQEIALPGSHDAGMSDKNGENLCLTRGCDCDTQTQTKTIYEQLGNGARYFDIRPNNLTWTDAPWWAGHFDDAEVVGWVGCAGQSLDSVLDDVARFCQEQLPLNGRELIVLNFSHCYRIYPDPNSTDGSKTGCDCSGDEWNDVLNTAEKKLGPYMVNWYPKYPNAAQAIFGDRGAGQYVLLRFETDAVPSMLYSGIYNSKQFPIYNNYSNSNSFSEMSADQQQKLLNPDNHAEELFLLSWTLTLSSGQATDCEVGSNPTSILDLASEADSQLMYSMNDWVKQGPVITQSHFPNIIYVDNFAPFATRAAIYLNKNYSTMHP